MSRTSGHVLRDRSLPALTCALTCALTIACGSDERRVAVYPEVSDGAQVNLTPALITQVTLPDNFVLRPDEFAGVVADPPRRLIYVGNRAGALMALHMEDGSVAWEVNFPGAISSEGVLAEDGALDRKKLAALVFGDEPKRAALNAIVHPIVTKLTFQRAAELRDEGHELACYEAALIVENGVADAFRPLVVVSAPEATQLTRACARDRASEEEIRARIRAQMPLAEKVKVADFVIENVGSLADLHRRTDEVLAAIGERLDVAPRSGRQ